MNNRFTALQRGLHWLHASANGSRLAIRHTPYFQRIGRAPSWDFVGDPDTWSARFRARDRKQAHKVLGGPLEFDEGKRPAETWLAQLAGSAVRSVKRTTAREALEAYLADYVRLGPGVSRSFWLSSSGAPGARGLSPRSQNSYGIA